MWKIASWHRLFGAAKKVQVLRFDGVCAYTVLRAIAIPLTPPTTSTASTAATDTAQAQGEGASKKKLPKPPANAMMFPALAELCLIDVDCETKDHHLNDLLLPALKRRMRIARLKKLVIGSCRVDEEKVEQLEELGLKVEWDGSTGETEDEDEYDCDFCDGEGCEECMSEFYDEDYY